MVTFGKETGAKDLGGGTVSWPVVTLPNVRVRLFSPRRGFTSPLIKNADEHEKMFVVSGAMTVTSGDQTVTLCPQDYCDIPPGESFKVAVEEDTEVICAYWRLAASV